VDTAQGDVPKRVTELLHHATGSHYTPETLMRAAERVYTLERLFLTQAGISRRDDAIAPRMLEPMPAGPIRGETFELDRLLDDYYAVRGWDQQGIPMPERLQALGLAHYAR
jgi:aldehyde:ferredoxin oxidoreductase